MVGVHLKGQPNGGANSSLRDDTDRGDKPSRVKQGVWPPYYPLHIATYLSISALMFDTSACHSDGCT